MAGRRIRFSIVALLVTILLSVSGLALVVTCDYERDLAFRAPLNQIALGLEQPEELLLAAVADTQARVGYKGSVSGGPTDARYDCGEEGCTLDGFWTTVAVDPVCPFGRDPDRRLAVTYTFDMDAGTVETTSVYAPWYGGINWTQIPLTFERAADVVKTSVPADFVERHPRYSIHMSAANSEWLVDVAAGTGDAQELLVYKINPANERVEPVGVAPV